MINNYNENWAIPEENIDFYNYYNSFFSNDDKQKNKVLEDVLDNCPIDMSNKEEVKAIVENNIQNELPNKDVKSAIACISFDNIKVKQEREIEEKTLQIFYKLLGIK